MNRKLISEAIGNIDDVFIEETMFFSEEDFGHPPERTTNMESKNINSRRIIGLVLAACLVFTFAVTAYAADIGGIRRLIQIWLYGEQTTAVLDVQNGQYTLTEEDGSFMQGGGHIKGMLLDEASKKTVLDNLAKLENKSDFEKKY